MSAEVTLGGPSFSRNFSSELQRMLENLLQFIYKFIFIQLLIQQDSAQRLWNQNKSESKYIWNVSVLLKKDVKRILLFFFFYDRLGHAFIKNVFKRQIFMIKNQTLLYSTCRISFLTYNLHFTLTLFAYDPHDSQKIRKV